MWQHGTQRGLANALIEIRQDLIRDAAGQAAWARPTSPHCDENSARHYRPKPAFNSRDEGCGDAGQLLLAPAALQWRSGDDQDRQEASRPSWKQRPSAAWSSICASATTCRTST